MDNPSCTAFPQTKSFAGAKLRLPIYLGAKLIAFIGSVLLGSLIMLIAFGSWEFDWKTYTTIMVFSGIFVLVFGVPASILLDLLVRQDRKGWFGLKLILHGLAGIFILGFTQIEPHDFSFYSCSLCYSLLFYLIYAGVKLKWEAKIAFRP